MKKKGVRKKNVLRFSAKKKNTDLMRLLVSHDEFQKDVRKAREYLHIPPDGFSHDSQTEAWTKEYCQRTEDMSRSPEFQRKLQRIRDDYESGKLDYKMRGKQWEMIHFNLPINYLTYTCRYLTEKYRIPANFSDSMYRYILFNQISIPLNNFAIGPFPDLKLPHERRDIPVTIYSQLTDEELQDLKREIELVGKRLLKFKPLKDIDKKLSIEEWFKNRARFDEVEKVEYKMSADEISENLLGSKRKKKRVYEAVRELKDLRKKRFGT